MNICQLMDFLYNGQRVRDTLATMLTTLSDSLACRYKRSMFIGYVNNCISKFGHFQPHILINLFKTYFCYFFLDLVRGG